MDLARKLLGPALLTVYIALIPMFVAKSENGLPEPELCSAGLLLPHIWFWFLHKHYPKAFFKRFLGCTEAQASTRLAGYWDSVRADDPHRLPCVERPHHRETAVPIGLHGDAVPCTKKDSMGVISFFSLLGSGPTVAICFFVLGIFSKAIVDFAVMAEFEAWGSGGSFDAVWDIVIWSLKALEDGVHPLTDHRGEAWTIEPFLTLAGTPWAGGFSATFMNFRADAEYTDCHLDLPGHWSSHCDVTHVTQTPLARSAHQRTTSHLGRPPPGI